MKAGILSGQVDLVVSSPSSNFCSLSVVKSREGMLGKRSFGLLGSDRLLSSILTG